MWHRTRAPSQHRYVRARVSVNSGTQHAVPWTAVSGHRHEMRPTLDCLKHGRTSCSSGDGFCAPTACVGASLGGVLVSARERSKSLTSEVWPYWTAASNGVSPPRSLAFTASSCAPWRRSAVALATRPS